MGKAFKLKPYQPTEAQTQKAVIEALCMDIRVFEVKRVNGGKIRVPGDAFGIYDAYTFWRKGKGASTRHHSDIEGQLVDGRRFVMEIKSLKGRVTEEQREFVDDAVAHGAVGGIVRSADEAVRMIREAFE